jgi:ribosomal protein S13
MRYNYTDSVYFNFIQNYGINKSLALKMCKTIRISPKKSFNLISQFKIQKAFLFLKQQKNKIGFELKNEEVQKFVHLYTIKHLRALKHKHFLPINGQRNKTNGITAKKMASKLKPIIYKQLKQISKREKNLKKTKTKKKTNSKVKKNNK